MDIVAITALGRSIEEEAPALAGDLGLTAYETGIMLRGAMPIVVLRSDDRSRAIGLLERLRGRGHQAIAVDTNAIVASEQMFHPKRFVLDGADLVATGEGTGTEQRLVGGSVFAFIRAVHATRVEDTVTKTTRQFSAARAALTSGLMTTTTKSVDSVRVTQEREPVVYAFRNDGEPWLFRSTALRFDGLGPRMQRSKSENFEVLLQRLRETSPQAPYDARLLAVRAVASTVVMSSSSHLSSSSSGTMDLLAHVVAISLRRGAYR